MHISYSRESSYLRCPYLHYLRYIEGLNSVKPARPLYFGSDFHKLLELRKDPDAVKKAWREMRDKFYEMPGSWQSELGSDYPQDLRNIFQDYQKMWKGAPTPKVTEKSFELNIGYYKNEDIIFVGVIDELYKYRDRDGNKSIEIGEHKTFSRPPDMNTLVMNTQKSLYCKAAQMIWGILPRTVIWDYIRSTPAKSPIWLQKSNRFSTAKSQEITPESWKRACKEKGITDPSILEQGEIYKGNENNFFFRVQQDVYPQMVEDVFEGFVYTCKDIVRRGGENKTKNMTRDCAWCTYRNICLAEMSGGDRKYVIDKEFTTREQRQEMEDEDGRKQKM